MLVKVVVAATSADGTPDFFACCVECYQHQYDEGEHYDKAKEAAEDEGYEGPMVAFDENDGPAFLFEHLCGADLPVIEAREQIG